MQYKPHAAVFRSLAQNLRLILCFVVILRIKKKTSRIFNKFLLAIYHFRLTLQKQTQHYYCVNTEKDSVSHAPQSYREINARCVVCPEVKALYSSVPSVVAICLYNICTVSSLLITLKRVPTLVLTSRTRRKQIPDKVSFSFARWFFHIFFKLVNLSRTVLLSSASPSVG